tara:strand:+ start:679 stop:1419 length:741 start_codon:yes stop_codon:yes gene_type:complete
MKEIYKLKFSFTLLSHLLKSIFYKYHSDKRKIIKEIMPQPEVVIDIGAHAGQVSKMISHTYNNAVKIIAIEPGVYARFILRMSIFFNRLKHVHVLPFAISNKAGFSFLNVPEKRKNSLGFGLSHMSNGHEDFTNRNFKIHYDYVAVTTIDQIVDDLKLKTVNFIKIDIEGFEYKALLGAQKTLKKYKPIIYIELQKHSLARNSDSLDDLYNYLRKMGYKSYYVRNDKLVKYEDNIEEDEVFFIHNK